MAGMKKPNDHAEPTKSNAKNTHQKRQNDCYAEYVIDIEFCSVVINHRKTSCVDVKLSQNSHD